MALFPILSSVLIALFSLLLGSTPFISAKEMPLHGTGMDVIIVSTSTKDQQAFWERRLNSSRGSLIKEDAYLFVLLEEWPGGAGNGYGTLHAYSQAQKLSNELYGFDLLKYQAEGHTVAIYHTAGQGKRLSPLTASEKNNKSAVKLPADLGFIKDEHTIAILEAVIWQTAPLAHERKGRLCVFWGDQVFLSSHPLKDRPDAEIEIFAKSLKFPSRAKWAKEGLDKYGLFASDAQNACCYLEKASYDTIEGLVAKGKIDLEKRAAMSIGSFSLTASMLEGLLKEFALELKEKKEMMNVEHSLWMPLSLDLETYCSLMRSMGWNQAQAKAQHERISAYKEKYLKDQAPKRLIAISDIGEDGYWWDYGTIKNYYANILKLCQQSQEAEAMRAFFGLSYSTGVKTEGPLKVDHNSIVLGSNIKSGVIENSIVIDVEGNYIHLKNAVSIHGIFNALSAQDSLLYNVNEPHEFYSPPGNVRADLFFKDQSPIKIFTLLHRDGKSDWTYKLEGNPYSYAELEMLNAQATTEP